MAELFFLRHGTRADHAPASDPPIYLDARPYDPLISVSLIAQIEKVAHQIAECAGEKRTIYVHFLPYLRCCQTADLLVSALLKLLDLPKMHLLGDFALSEWVHDKMKNQPPFVDSTEAYQMYTPNVKLLENRRFCANFRPTTTLGPYNEPDLLFKDYSDRCKSYFKKLVATYDKPSHASDLVVVVAHGYVINNFLLYFINHPIFEEIPEALVNYARKVDGSWRLERDCLGILDREDVDSTLNLETDIVYYKTNFIKRDELDEARQYPTMGFGGLLNERPRPSFRMKSTSASTPTSSKTSLASLNPLCPAAKTWDPRDAHKFRVKADFAKKVMNDEAFKRAFDLSHRPAHPVSPEISPSSEPTRGNSRVNLLKLLSNDEIYHPFKLRYSLASDIPVQYLNSKVNSHASLPQLKNSNNSMLDLARAGSYSGLLSPRDLLDVEMGDMNEVIGRLSRIRSLQRRRPAPAFGKIDEQQALDTSDEHKFALSFHQKTPRADPQPVVPRNSIKFIPSLDHKKAERPEPRREKSKSMFYNLDSGSSSGNEDSSLDEEPPKVQEKEYMWFGQNTALEA